MKQEETIVKIQCAVIAIDGIKILEQDCEIILKEQIKFLHGEEARIAIESETNRQISYLEVETMWPCGFPVSRGVKCATRTKLPTNYNQKNKYRGELRITPIDNVTCSTGATIYVVVSRKHKDFLIFDAHISKNRPNGDQICRFERV